MTVYLDGRLHAIIQGHVQGVGFRYFVQGKATSLGLKGWVRNRWDGSVEVLTEGKRTELELLLDALYRGPRGATVTNVDPQWQEATGEFLEFQVRMTAY
jgi:acylphosphatase